MDLGYAQYEYAQRGQIHVGVLWQWSRLWPFVFMVSAQGIGK